MGPACRTPGPEAFLNTALPVSKSKTRDGQWKGTEAEPFSCLQLLSVELAFLDSCARPGASQG